MIPMLVGIISLNIHTLKVNFGAVTHSFAFQKALDSLGVDNLVIDYRPNYSLGKFEDPKYPLLHFVNAPSDNEKKQKFNLDLWKNNFYTHIRRYEKVQKFISDNYRITRQSYNEILLVLQRRSNVRSKIKKKALKK
jgi:hypothetical protein